MTHHHVEVLSAVELLYLGSHRKVFNSLRVLLKDNVAVRSVGEKQGEDIVLLVPSMNCLMVRFFLVRVR